MKSGQKGTTATAATVGNTKGKSDKKVKCGYFMCTYKDVCGKCAGNCNIKFDCDNCQSVMYCKSAESVKSIGGN